MFVCGSSSPPSHDIGVLPDSVLECVLYPFGNLIQFHNFRKPLYADDSKLFIFTPDFPLALTKLIYLTTFSRSSIRSLVHISNFSKIKIQVFTHKIVTHILSHLRKWKHPPFQQLRPNILKLALIPFLYPIHQEILMALPLKHTKNSTASHHQAGPM